jgi:hypothetical protein
MPTKQGPTDECMQQAACSILVKCTVTRGVLGLIVRVLALSSIKSEPSLIIAEKKVAMHAAGGLPGLLVSRACAVTHGLTDVHRPSAIG